MEQIITKGYLDSGNTNNSALVSGANDVGMQTILQSLIRIDAKTPAWYSQARDIYLRDEVYRNPFMDSIVNTVAMKIMNIPLKIISRDSGVEKYNKLAETYNDILIEALAENQTLEKFVRSFLTQDNGGFMFISGDDTADRPLTTIPTGLLHLDSTRCVRTGNREFPVVFHDIDNKRYKIHHTRIIFCSQSPSTSVDMNGVGFSFASRALMLSQHIYDIFSYEGEVMGSRSSEEIIYGTGMRSQDIQQAFDLADVSSDNAGLSRVGKRVYMGIRDPNGKLGKLQLKSLPENFNKRDDIEITLTLIAMASGGSPGWFYDSVKSGSTKASASESTKIGESKLELWYVNMITDELNHKFLPYSLMSLAGEEDIDNSGTKARIKLNLAQTTTQNINSGVTDVRTERELKMQRGELTKSQFDILELKDGRTSTGLPLYTLYQTDIESLRNLIYFTDDPMNFTVNINDETILDKIDKYWEVAQSTALNARTNGMANYGIQAMYLLQYTRDQYELLLGVSPRYQFNTGLDTVVNNGTISLNSVPDNKLSVLPEESESNTVVTNGDIRSGINDDSVIDNYDAQKDFKLDKYFTTRHQREYRSKLRAIARAAWNGDLTLNEYRQQYTDTVRECFGDNVAGYLKVQNRIEDLTEHVSNNLRADGGLLPVINRELDRWILAYIGIENES